MKVLLIIIIALVATAIFCCNYYRQSSSETLQVGHYKVIEKGVFPQAQTAVITPTGFFGKLWMITLLNNKDIPFTYLTIFRDNDVYSVHDVDKPSVSYPVIIGSKTVTIFYNNSTLKLQRKTHE